MIARENPFRTERLLGLRYRFRDGDWESLLATLAVMGYRAAIVGPEGSGKSKLLSETAPRLEALGFTLRKLTLHEKDGRQSGRLARQFLASVAPGDIILVDGAEQMGLLAWTRFRAAARTASGLLVTTHRPGRLPTLVECTTWPDLLDEILFELLGDEALLWHDRARRLYLRRGGNVREVLLDLYDAFSLQ
jgi:hypothetical protein